MGLGTEGRAGVTRHISSVEYEQLISGIREVVYRVVPLNATVLVVSKGDDQLLELGARQTLHFPQDEQGQYAGYHPADSDAAIAMLEDLREKKGAEYLLLPSTGFWWLDHYEGFRQYLEQRYQVVDSGEHCWIVGLSKGIDLAADAPLMAEAPSGPDLLHPMREVVEGLLPATARIAFLAVHPEDLADLDGHEAWLMPQGAAESVAQNESLKKLEESDIEFLVIPAAAFAWLDDHPQLTERLRSRHRFITRQEHLCEIYELRALPTEPILHGREESNAHGRSFGEKLRGILFPSRRNGRQP